MEDRINHWLCNIHMVLIIILSIPIFFDAQNQKWAAFILVGVLILIQCYHYVSTIHVPVLEGKDVYIHYLCIAGKVLLVTWYLILTGYWIFSPLYYIMIHPRSKSEERVAFVLPVLGVMLVWLVKPMSSNELPWLLLAAMVAALITSLLHVVESVIIRITHREHLLREQMKITALNELKVINLNRELAIKYQLADLNARLEERENIARNIHNVVGHTITSAIVSLQACRVLRDTEPLQSEEKLTAASNRMRLALEEIRRAVRVLDQETQEISLKDFGQLMIAELKRFALDTELEVSHNLDYINSDQAIDKRYCEFLHSALTECLTNGISKYWRAQYLLIYF